MHHLPEGATVSKFVVCPACDGEGRDFSTSIAMTSSDIDEYAGADYYDRMAFVTAIAELTAPCPFCSGQRVVIASAIKEWEDELEYRAEIAAEERMERYMGGEW
jgi:hypothetical protein